MSETTKHQCYRDRDNGVYFQRQQHRHDCGEGECRGCVVCPERHCTKAKNCAWHIAEGELTCGRCLGSTRRDLAWIDSLSPLMLTAALADGVDSEAANLAGPSADYGVFSARRQIDKRWIIANLPAGRHERAMVNLIPDDDEHHPLSVLGRWTMMLAEDYDHDLPPRLTVASSAAYLDRILHRVAQDDEQDFPLMSREFRKCRQHLEVVLQNDNRPERGAPCPACHEAGVKPAPRLQLELGHWCLDAKCERIHYADESGDVWRCPRDGAHEWSEYDYRLRVADWHAEAKETA